MADGKRDLRAEMRRVRAAIPDRARRAASIRMQVLDHCHRLNARTVMAFIGVGNEPDTFPLVEELLVDGFQVVLPRVEGDRIVPVHHDPGDELVAGAFGIPHPTGPPIDPAVVDVVLVPGLAFTADGRRLGQGGGFYDHFLPSLRAGCVSIGVCFAAQIVAELTIEPHDWIVDVVVTEIDPLPHLTGVVPE